VATYSTYCRLYALRGLARVLGVLAAGASGPLPPSLPPADLPAQLGGGERWAHELAVLREEYAPELAGPRPWAVRELLQAWVAAEAQLARTALETKAKDDRRGPEVIPDYAVAHRPAALEPVVREAQAFATEAAATGGRLLARL
jgi:hypothetical protein